MPDEEEIINMKIHEIFQHTKSLGIVDLQFLGVLCLIFHDKKIKRIKNGLTELYENLSYKTLSGTQIF